MAEAADFQGTPPAPARRRWLRRAVVLLAGTPVLAGLVYVPAASAAPEAEAAGGTRVDVSVDTITPQAPVEGDTVTISGTLTNKGRETVTDAHVGLRIGPVLNSRDSIDAAAERGAFRPGTDPAEIGEPYEVEIDTLLSKVARPFSLKVPVEELGLDEAGVYQLGVSVSGETETRRYEQVLGIERTFLPWQPEAMENRSQLTYVWPLISTAHVTAETGSDEQQTPVFSDDELASELAPGGRLEQLVSLGSQLDVTWLIDPDLLASADAMAQRDYQVRTADGGLVPGTGRAVAAQWLGSLEAAVQGKKVVALPFADPDLASLAHQGKKVSGALSQLRPATEKAGQAVETILHVTPSTDFAWPVDGAIDPAVVNVATSAGAHYVLARSDSLRETRGLGYTPSSARPIGGGTTAVVADERLSKAFQGDMSRAETSTLAVQRFLAQSLALSLQDTDDQRSIVVTPQRMPTAAQAQTMAAALREMKANRWTQPVDLETAAKAKPDPGATTTVPSTGRYPASLRKSELPRTAFEEIHSTGTTLNHFQVILSYPQRVGIPFGNTVDREMSTSWRGRAAQARDYRRSTQEYLISLTRKVQLIPKSDAMLSGRSATIPVTVQNSLVQDVERLVLRLKSGNATRLKFNGKAQAEQSIRVQGGHSQSFKFEASASASGPIEVTAQLFTEDGVAYGEPRTFTVEATEITATVMFVIAGGMLLLVLAGIRMYKSRKRAAARAVDGQPSDPMPDTGPENGNTSSPGEKVNR
ncbi:DUF6049 family protein [Streptomyces sp. NPDC006879]|uniref:DUF6049 family protein n=1 Tax=Streptomyces sp. NPDC006879 TaxID=3364767 RepID=UPI00368F25AF